MLKKSILAASLAVCALSAHAVEYYLVTPMPTAIAPGVNIALTLSSYALPAGLVSEAYPGFDLNTLLSVTGDASYTGSGATWRVAQGALPAGLSINATGQLAGTPAAAGTSSFTLAATYKTKSGTQSYQLVVTNLTVAMAAATLPTGTVGTAYRYDFKPLLQVTGDSSMDATQLTFGLAPGAALPANLTLSANGVLSGSPTAAGATSFVVQATYKGRNGQQTYSMQVNVAVADATWVPTSIGGTLNGTPTYANGNHTVVLPAGLNAVAASTPLPSSGKWYWESVREAGNYGISGMSVRPISSYSGNQPSSCGLYMYFTAPELLAASNSSKSAVTSVPFNTTIGHAYDAATRTLTFYLGNNRLGSCTVPGTTTLYPTAANGSSGNGGSSFTLRTLPSQMSYAPPAGYTAGLPGQ